MLLHVVILAAGLALATSQDCDGELTIPARPHSGIMLNSSNYPEPHPKYAICSWLITGTTPGPLYQAVLFSNGQIELTGFSILVSSEDREREDEQVSGPEAKFCGGDGLVDLVAKTNNVRAVFVRNGDREALGFRIVTTTGTFRR
ncbi:hypothetical protein BV898_00344 [Hypsibius exemplaris]|uniref:CUB domain-containing protein n=1 Tax=Hypsibius exemplaris TaxID=2072580 RepID=A0A1W0XFG9_HYPEX|nr:hypothetical protein BV898_00344 [Hypsibius exemplaris]